MLWRRYRRHAGAKFRLLNEQFIELFDVDLASRMRALEPLLERARGRVGGGAAGGAGGRGQSHSPRGPARAWQVNIPLTAPLWLRWYQPAALERT